MDLWFKKIQVPETNETKEVDAVGLWEVRWQSRNGEYSHDTQPELECFTSEGLAKDFAESLRKAFRLIRHTSGDGVSIRRAR